MEKKVVAEAGSEAPPETLADKVAQVRCGREFLVGLCVVLGCLVLYRTG